MTWSFHRARQQQNIPQARRGVNASDMHEDLFISPLITLNAPARFYFAFGKPITTTPDMASDRAACDAVYADVKGGVEGLMGYLLRRRLSDPYGEALPRLLYEATWQGRQAPTFKP